METVNEPFYYFILSMNQKKEIIKSNIEHYNPFLNLNSKNINIGLFGDKTKLAFRYVYGDYYEQYYLNYKNFSNVDLVKVIECDNQVRPVAVIDSSMIDFVDKKYYSSVQGLIFVFKINILLSNNYIETIKSIYNEAKEAVEGELLFEIALCINEDENIQIINQTEKIREIHDEFKCKVFPFSLKTGENVNEIFYFLMKKIIQHNKKH